jgi:hypothetical protein
LHLFGALRREQAALVIATPAASESGRTLALAQAAYRDIEALIVGGQSDALDTARDGEWTLRDLLRHAIAVELRYCEQVIYSATRKDHEPVGIPAGRLPCDRLSPPDLEYAASKDGDAARVLELLGIARQRTDARLTALSQASLDRPSLWGTLNVDVRERLHQIAAHLVEATIQAEKMLGETSGGEARRIVRRIWATRGMHERVSPRGVLDGLNDQLRGLAQTATS